MPYGRVLELLREGRGEAEELLSRIAGEAIGGRGRREFAVMPLYNAGLYLGRRSDALSDAAVLRLILRLYDELLGSAPAEPEELAWASVEVRGQVVYVAGAGNPPYTYLYKTDAGFRGALDALLSPGHAGCPVNV